jgi:hypothetical protein
MPLQEAVDELNAAMRDTKYDDNARFHALQEKYFEAKKRLKELGIEI